MRRPPNERPDVPHALRRGQAHPSRDTVTFLVMAAVLDLMLSDRCCGSGEELVRCDRIQHVAALRLKPTSVDWHLPRNLRPE